MAGRASKLSDGAGADFRVGPSHQSGVLMDLVYLVRSGPNEELRYSLRSIEKNAPGLFRKVWVMGTDLPDWLTGVEFLPIPDGDHKHETMRRKTLAVCDNPDVTPTFGLMNDDYFLVKPISEWVVYHMGPASEWINEKLAKRSWSWTSYLRDVYATCRWMADQGYGDVPVRETHSITVWDRVRLAEVIRAYPQNRGLTVVDLYEAAGAGGPGVRGPNAKVHNDEHLAARLKDGWPWLSSSDESWVSSRIGEYMRGMFPEPSRFEKVGA